MGVDDMSEKVNQSTTLQIWNKLTQTVKDRGGA